MITSRNASRAASPAASESSITSSSGGLGKAAFPLLPRRISVGKGEGGGGSLLISSSSSLSKANFGWIDFAMQGNPTLQVRLTRRWSISLTYAEILQYLCIILSLRHFVSLSAAPALPSSSSSSPSYSPSSSPSSNPQDVQTHGGGERSDLLSTRENDTRSVAEPPLTLLPIYVNFLLLLISTTTLGIRRRAEHLGLRQTSLLLCLILLLLTVVLGGGHLSTLHDVLTTSSKTTRARDRQVDFHRQSAKGYAYQHIHEGPVCARTELGNWVYQPLSDAASTVCHQRDEDPGRDAQVRSAMLSTGQALFGSDGDDTLNTSLIDDLCRLLHTKEAKDPLRARLRRQNGRNSVVIECG